MQNWIFCSATQLPPTAIHLQKAIVSHWGNRKRPDLEVDKRFVENASVSKVYVNPDQILEGNWVYNSCGWQQKIQFSGWEMWNLLRKIPRLQNGFRGCSRKRKAIILQTRRHSKPTQMRSHWDRFALAVLLIKNLQICDVLPSLVQHPFGLIVL